MFHYVYDNLRCRNYLTLLALGGILHNRSASQFYKNTPPVAWADGFDPIFDQLTKTTEISKHQQNPMQQWLKQLGLPTELYNKPFPQLLLRRLSEVSQDRIDEWKKSQELEALRQENAQLRQQLKEFQSTNPAT